MDCPIGLLSVNPASLAVRLIDALSTCNMLLNFVPVNRNVKKNVKPKLVPRKPYIADYSKVNALRPVLTITTYCLPFLPM